MEPMVVLPEFTWKSGRKSFVGDSKTIRGVYCGEWVTIVDTYERNQAGEEASFPYEQISIFEAQRHEGVNI
eukprot:1162028-Pelagomonas_calceolata.AAC.9